MIPKEAVKKIAKLARLGLTEKEIEKFQKDLSSILDYFEKLKEVDISGVQATSHSIEIESVMRKDGTEKIKPENQKKLMDLMPEKKESYLKVKSIL